MKQPCSLAVHLFCFVSASIFCRKCFGQFGAAQAVPVIQETVPAPFDSYPLGPDSQTQSGVPTGKVFTFDMENSKIFPHTARRITVYVPSEYKADAPACVYVGLDGLHFKAPVVFDNLIVQHAMPITIAVGLDPGSVISAKAPLNPRFDRSLEFDTLSDRLARFVLEELIPEVERHRTPDGKPIRLSTNPDDRAIGGASTGGIGAFTVAWERPDAFHRVFTSIGTFVGMRGGDGYYVLVRKTEPKPLRVFMEDGVHDEWVGGPEFGDWWMSNQTMARALEFAGYDVKHIWGAGTHNESHAASVFPDAMRWLWRDWSNPVRARDPGNPILQAVLQSGEEWHIAREKCATTMHIAANPQGQVYYSTDDRREIVPVISNDPKDGCSPSAGGRPFAFGANGEIYQSRISGGIEVRSTTVSGGRQGLHAHGLIARCLTVQNNGDMYLLTADRGGKNELWFVPLHGKPKRQDENLKGASGLAQSPDGLWLFVAQSLSRTGISYRVNSDGTLDSREDFYTLYAPSTADDSGASGVSVDREGRTYVGTTTGVQIVDRNGRVTAILPMPGNEAVTDLCFGGDNFDTLFVAAGGKVYYRKLRTAGAPPWSKPIALPPWTAG